ncbi:MAG: NAD(P)-dependent oxidoreductase, partial [Elusimicrobiota bacterium]|nr:NAD(P)-dependent oxidoreductase [Elusimicrobiota bacterium]
MKKAAITGGNGFVGRQLTDFLLANGYSVRILSRSKPSGRDINPSVETVQVNYFDAASIKQALDGVDTVFHLAAAIFAFNTEEFHQANTVLTKNLTAAASEIKTINTFVYLSSQAAAGPSQYKDNPKTEDEPPAPVSDYGATKLAAEAFVLALPEAIHKVVLRAPIVYGKNDSGVSKIAAWVARGIMVNTSSGEAFFNFIYVEDLVAALYKAATTPKANGQVYF